jgi:hypothetical protein
VNSKNLPADMKKGVAGGTRFNLTNFTDLGDSYTLVGLM